MSLHARSFCVSLKSNNSIVEVVTGLLRKCFTLGAQFNSNRVGLCQYKTSRLHRCTGVSSCTPRTGTHIHKMYSYFKIESHFQYNSMLSFRISGIYFWVEDLDGGKRLKNEKIVEQKKKQLQALSMPGKARPLTC